MVGGLDGTVYLTFQDAEAVAGKNMVDTKIEMILVVCKSGTGSSLRIYIVQSLTYDPVCIRNGRIVKVTAYQHVAGTIFSNSMSYRIYLWSTYSYHLSQFMKQVFPAIFQILFSRRFQHIIVHTLIVGIQLVRFQVVIDQYKCITPNFQPVKYAGIRFRLIVYGIC